MSDWSTTYAEAKVACGDWADPPLSAAESKAQRDKRERAEKRKSAARARRKGRAAK